MMIKRILFLLPDLELDGFNRFGIMAIVIMDHVNALGQNVELGKLDSAYLAGKNLHCFCLQDSPACINKLNVCRSALGWFDHDSELVGKRYRVCADGG